MMARRFFTSDNPPKSGKAKLLWNWFIDQGRDETGYPNYIPQALYINNPRRMSNPHGTCKYVLQYNGVDFMTDDVLKTISKSIPSDWNSKDVVYLDYEQIS